MIYFVQGISDSSTAKKKSKDRKVAKSKVVKASQKKVAKKEASPIKKKTSKKVIEKTEEEKQAEIDAALDLINQPYPSEQAPA